MARLMEKESFNTGGFDDYNDSSKQQKKEEKHLEKIFMEDFI